MKPNDELDDKQQPQQPPPQVPPPSEPDSGESDADGEVPSPGKGPGG